MQTEKKCPSCGEWTFWEKKVDDRCSHCGALLDPHFHKHISDRMEKERVFRENDFFTIREDDNFFMILVRKTGWALHAVFAFITWAFLWFVTTFSG